MLAQFGVPSRSRMRAQGQYADVLKALPVAFWRSMHLQQYTAEGSCFMVIDSCPHEQVAMRCILSPSKAVGAPEIIGPNRVARKLIYINFAKFKVGGASGVGTFELADGPRLCLLVGLDRK